MFKDIIDLKPHPLNRKIYGNEVLPESFIESIKSRGVLEPLVIKPDGTIISGHRRWQAAKVIKLNQVPVVIKEFENELDEREAIIDYNRQREKTFSQKMAEAEELEAIERERAREREKKAGSIGGKFKGKETFPDPSKGQTRDKVAEQIGIGSGKQYEKAKKVWEEAKAGNEEAKKLIECLDKHGHCYLQ